MTEPNDETIEDVGHADTAEDLSTPDDDDQVEPGAEPYVEARTQSPDHPELQFVQAKGYTPGRPDGPPLWIVVHDMEASETATRAENTAAYFANPGDGRRVSSHYCADNNSVVQCVRTGDSAWTVGNRPGNNRGLNWELAGFASQSRAQWLDPFGRAMFAEIKPILVADAAKYGIPLVRRTVAELKAWRKGITSHNDLRLAFGGTTHTDPGGNFPWDVFLQTMNDDGGGDDMAALRDDWDFWVLEYRVRAMVWMEDPVVVPPHPQSGHPNGYTEPNLLAKAVLAAASGVGLTPEQFEELKAELAAAAEAGAEAGAPSLDEIRGVVDDELDEQSRAGADSD